MEITQEWRYSLPDGPTLDVDEHGRRIVLTAPDRIRLDPDGLNRMLEVFGANTRVPVDEDGTATLDDAGKYRYRRVEYNRRWNVGIYERVRS